jgi:putative ABC transport system permease protein
VRDWRKNLIACVAIFVGAVSLILFGGYVANMYAGIRLGSIYSQLGHYQVHSEQKGQGAYSKGFITPEAADEVAAKLEKLDQIKVVTKRVETQGLISFADKSVGVLAYGVEADKDAEISTAVNIIEGNGLFTSNAAGVLVGRELLEELGGNVGDVVTFLSTTNDGAINAVDLVVTGVMDTGASELNKRFIKFNLGMMEEVLRDKSVTNLVILADEEKIYPGLDAAVANAVKEVNPSLVVKDWSDMSEQYHQIVSMFDNIFGFVTSLVIVIVFAAILNTMTLGVLERVSELSTTRALGSSRGEIILIIMGEGLVVGVIGVLLGAVGGYLLAIAINYSQIPMPKPPGSTVSYPLAILMSAKVILLPSLLTLAAAVFGGVLPAYKAGKLPINEAINR